MAIRLAYVDASKAIAILAVFAYHMFPDVAKGGFIGVDIFLVVTGYLSAMSIDRYGVWRFLKGRLVRVYPSLSALLVLCFVVLLAVGYFNEVYNYAKYFISSSLLMTNFHLLMDHGYFSERNFSNPVFHLWSISLEIQAWALLAIISRLIGFGYWFALLASASFVASVVAFMRADVNLFYLVPLLRLWEVALGVYAFQWASRRAEGAWQPGASWRVMAVTALIAMTFLDLKSLPLLWMMVPLLTCVVILSSGELIGAWRAVAAYLSRRTYALYLWHVPVIVGVTYYYANHALSAVPWMILMILLIAELSYRFLEGTPRPRTRRESADALQSG